MRRGRLRSFVLLAFVALSSCGPGLPGLGGGPSAAPAPKLARAAFVDEVPYGELPVAAPGLARALEPAVFAKPRRIVASRTGSTVLVDEGGHLALLGAAGHAPLPFPALVTLEAPLVLVPRGEAGLGAVCATYADVLECLVGPADASLDDVVLGKGGGDRLRRVAFALHVEEPAGDAGASAPSPAGSRAFATTLRGTGAVCFARDPGRTTCFALGRGPDGVPRLEPLPLRPTIPASAERFVERAGPAFAGEWTAAEGQAFAAALQLDGGEGGADPYGASAWNVGDVPAGEPLRHGCAVARDGVVRCFGANAYGQLGLGAPSAGLARGVAAGIDAVEVAVGLAHTCARTRDGHVACWGDAGLGGFELPAGTRSTRLDVCPRDRRASLGLTTGGHEALVFDHQALCEEPTGTRGDDGAFRRDDAEARTRIVARPTVVPDLLGVVSIAAAGRRTWAVRADGSIVRLGG